MYALMSMPKQVLGDDALDALSDAVDVFARNAVNGPLPKVPEDDALDALSKALDVLAQNAINGPLPNDGAGNAAMVQALTSAINARNAPTLAQLQANTAVLLEQIRSVTAVVVAYMQAQATAGVGANSVTVGELQSATAITVANDQSATAITVANAQAQGAAAVATINGNYMLEVVLLGVASAFFMAAKSPEGSARIERFTTGTIFIFDSIARVWQNATNRQTAVPLYERYGTSSRSRTRPYIISPMNWTGEGKLREVAAEIMPQPNATATEAAAKAAWLAKQDLPGSSWASGSPRPKRTRFNYAYADPQDDLPNGTPPPNSTERPGNVTVRGGDNVKANVVDE